MKCNRQLLVKLLSLSALTLIVLLCTDVFAMEEASKGRKIWDNIMLWINFGILVFVFIKFGKKPLMAFLHGEKNKIETSISTVDGQLQEARSLMEEEAVKLESMDEHLKSVLKNILELGEKEKDSIISKAKATSAKMLEDAEKDSQYQLEIAKNSFKEEMLEMAVSLSVEKLKKELTSKDDEIIVEQFAAGIGDMNEELIEQSY